MTDDACRSCIQEDSVCSTRLLQDVITSSAVDHNYHNPRRITTTINWYVFIPRCIKSESQLLKDATGNASVKAASGTNNSSFAYHETLFPNWNKLLAMSALLPLFHEQVKSVELIWSDVTKLNQCQTSVVVVDYLLFLLWKRLPTDQRFLEWWWEIENGVLKGQIVSLL